MIAFNILAPYSELPGLACFQALLADGLGKDNYKAIMKQTSSPSLSWRFGHAEGFRNVEQTTYEVFPK